jgi:cell division protein FtsQ
MPRKRKNKSESRSQPQARGKNRSRLSVFFRRAGLAALAACIVAAAGLWLAGGGADKSGNWLQNRLYSASAQAGFTVQDVVVAGRARTDADTLRGLIGVRRGDPILAFRPDEARETLKRVSWIKDAEVERRLPHTIYIRLTERRPLAVWQNKHKLRLIDADGVTLGDDLNKGGAGLLLVVGDDAPQNAAALIGLLDAEPALRARVDAASRVGGRRWDLRLKNGISVRLPEKDTALALRRLAEAQLKDALLDKDIKSVDMREPDRIVVETAKGAARYTPGKGGSDI